MEKFGVLFEVQNKAVDGHTLDVRLGPLLVARAALAGREISKGTDETVTRVANMSRLDKVGQLSFLGILCHVVNGAMYTNYMVSTGIVE